MKYFPALTGLRALAAYLVFFHHFNFFCHFNKNSVLSRMVDEFYIGVSIFFVLSGFLIYYRYAERSEMSREFWLNYFKHRFARVYPMFFLLTTATFIVMIVFQTTSFTIGENGILYILNITFLKGFFDNFKFSGIVQGWTLTVEECFYFLAPLVIIFFKPGFKWLLIALSSYLIGFIFILTLGSLDFYGLFGNGQFTFAYTIFGRIFEFFVGMYLASLCKRKSSLIPSRGFLFTGAGSVLVLLTVYFLALIKKEFHVQQGIYHPLGIMLNNLFLPFAVSSLIFGLVYEINFFSKILSSKIFIALGKSSYVFYLIHMGILYELIVYLNPSDRYVFPFVVLNIISLFLYKYVEKPINSFVLRIG